MDTQALNPTPRPTERMRQLLHSRRFHSMARLVARVMALLCIAHAAAESCEAACVAASDAGYCARLGGAGGAGRNRAQLSGVCTTAWAAGAAAGCARGCGGATCVGMGLAEALNAARSAACAGLGGAGAAGAGGVGARALDVCREGFILAARDGCAQAERVLVAANATQERLFAAVAAVEAAAAAAAAAEAASAANVSTMVRLARDESTHMRFVCCH